MLNESELDKEEVLEEEIMLCTRVDIIDNDHGYASLTVDLNNGRGSHQSFITSPDKSYEIMRLFDTDTLAKCRGPVIACRQEHYGYIRKLKRLPCYEAYEVSHE